MGDDCLWFTADIQGRVAELTASTRDPVKELPLRRDVRSLGTLLGRVLIEQGGEELFEIVERLRRLLIEHREQSHDASNLPSQATSSNHGPDRAKLKEARDLVSR